MADPLELAQFLRRLNAARPVNLQAVYWFRLPVAGERRSFSPASWQSLRQDPAGLVAQSAAAALSLDAVPQGAGRWLWQMHNASGVDVAWPVVPPLPSQCTQTVPVTTDTPALLRSGERVAAFENECPHAARRLDWAPGRFLVEDGLLICAAHGAMFAIPGGECVSGPCRGESLQAVPTHVVDGAVDLDER